MKIEGGWQPPAETAAKLAAAGAGERLELTARAFLNHTREYLRIDNPDDELKLERSETDELNTTHLRFSQTYGGLRVWPGELIVHLNADNKVYLVDGAFFPTPKNLDTKPAIASESAAEAARLRVPGADKANVSEPELIIYGQLEKPARLAWKMDVDVNPASHWLVIVDAQNGNILFANSTVENVNKVGSGVDLLGQTDTLDVWYNGGPYYLCDTSKPMFSKTGKAPSSGVPDLTNTNGTIIILDAAHQSPDTGPFDPGIAKSSSLTSSWLKDAVSAHLNFNWTYEYYLNTFGRNSIDGNGMNIPAIVRVDESGQSWLNACWNPNLQLMLFGDEKPLAAATDVIGHELTHGVTNHTANLGGNGTGQTGALNEGFSDVFGKMVEYYSHGSKGAIDWIMGDSVGVSLRNLKDPNSQITGECGEGNPYPASMSQYYDPTIFGLSDGGVHCNSNIFSHSFYMLAMGLSTAIGLPDAQAIYFRALTKHLTSQAQFIDARLACVQSATELFGKNSNQVKQTGAAFDAVQIYSGSATPTPAPSPSGSAGDSLVFIAYDSSWGMYVVARYESAKGDPTYGVPISSPDYPASPYQRPSVTSDGKFAAYVTADNDLCIIKTDGSGGTCAGVYNVWSCAMSPDGGSVGYVLLSNGQPDNKINVSTSGSTKTYTLVAAATEGAKAGTVEYAETMTFTSSGRYLIYDALNYLTMSDNSQVEAWSIYAIDRTTGQTLALITPYPGLNIGDPAIGHTSDYFLAFEAVLEPTDVKPGAAYVFACNLNSGKCAYDDAVPIGIGAVTYAVPAFTGDDLKIVFSVPYGYPDFLDAYSIWLQPLESDHITPSGGGANKNEYEWIADGDFGVAYRRDNLSSLNVTNASPSKGLVTSNVGTIACGESCSYLYPSGTTVTLAANAYGGDKFLGWSGACSGTGPCQVTLKNAAVNVSASFVGPPVVDCPSASGITSTGAKLGAEIISNGGEKITASGVAYGESANPTASGTHVNTNPVVQSKEFTANVKNLTPNTVYHYRGYATNSAGMTAYTADATFKTASHP
jgi:Zn-dependent metalloprotease